MIDVRKLEADSGLQSRAYRRGVETTEASPVAKEKQSCGQCGKVLTGRKPKSGLCRDCRGDETPAALGGGKKRAGRMKKTGPCIDLIGALRGERERLAGRLAAIERAIAALEE